MLKWVKKKEVKTANLFSSYKKNTGTTYNNHVKQTARMLNA
jgi:hypothetical protein